MTTESGAPLPEAVLEIDEETLSADDRGVIRIELVGPRAGVLRADGHLDEPIVVSGSDPNVDQCNVGQSRTEWRFEVLPSLCG